MNRFDTSARVGFLAAIGLGVLACAPAPPGGPAAPPPGQPPAAAQPAGPKPGGVARFGTIGKPPNAHPYLSAAGAGLLTLSGTVWDPLIDFDYTVEDYRADFPLVPMLAESWKLENPTAYLFKVRQGVKWHDGEDLTVDGVIWSLEYMRDRKEGFAGRARLAGVGQIAKVDAASFRMALDGPNPNLLNQLAGAVGNPLPILPKHVYDEGGTALMKDKAIGTGPFKMVKFDPTGTTVMARNESYWRKDAQGRAYPYVQGLEFIHNMDRSTNEAAFAAQEVDLVHFQVKAHLDALKASYADFDVQPHHSGHGTALVFNVAKKPFDDLRVRKAAFLAMDFHELNQTVLGGFGKMSGPVTPGIKKGWGFSEEELLQMPGFRKDKAQDLAEAKKLLAEAGYPSGLKVTMMYDRAWGSAPLAEYVPISLKRAGFDVQALGLDSPNHLQKYESGDFELNWYHVANEEPLRRLDLHFSSKEVYAKGAGINDPEMDRLIEQLRQESSAAEQKRLVRAMAELQVKNYYVRNVGDPAFFRGEQKWLKGYRSYFTAQAAPGASAFSFWLDQEIMPAKRKR